MVRLLYRGVLVGEVGRASSRGDLFLCALTLRLDPEATGDAAEVLHYLRFSVDWDRRYEQSMNGGGPRPSPSEFEPFGSLPNEGWLVAVDSGQSCEAERVQFLAPGMVQFEMPQTEAPEWWVLRGALDAREARPLAETGQQCSGLWSWSERQRETWPHGHGALLRSLHRASRSGAASGSGPALSRLKYQ